MSRAQLSFILLCLLGLALSAASQPCALRFYMPGRQRKRAVFTAETMDTAMGHRLTCACNKTKGRSPIFWVDGNGLKVTTGAIVDYKVARRNKGKAAHLRIKRGFSCAEAGEYTCVVGDTRRSVFVTPRGVNCPPKQCSNDDEVCKGTNNDLQYRVISLPNALRVLLISNNKTSTAAAAMDVHAGYFQDTIPGMAHFCEHMLFLGTEKYPEEGSYSQFLTTNGRTWNGFTRSENTNYFFSVNSEKLMEALDIFAQFFIGPLFTESAVNREINAVNAEFELTRGVPDWRFIFIMQDIADQMSEYSRLMLLDPRYSDPELLEALNNITIDELPAALAQHMDNIQSSISRLECYVTGNVGRDRAIVYSGTIHKALTQNSTTGEMQEGNPRVVKLKQGTTALATRTLNPAADDNSAIMVVKQDACFTTLRTREQLGYVVFCGTFCLDTIVNTYFIIQSTIREPPYLLDRINNFTRTFYAITVLKSAFFEQGLESLIALLRADSKNLQEQVNRLWPQIHNQYYNFDCREALLNTTERVTHARFVNFYNTYMIGKLGMEGQTSDRELVVGAFKGGIATASFDVPRQVEDEDQYDSVREFKKSAKYWDQ